MAVTISLTVSNTDATRVLTAMGYPNPSVLDAPASAFFKNWLTIYLTGMVNGYDRQNAAINPIAVT